MCRMRPAFGRKAAIGQSEVFGSGVAVDMGVPGGSFNSLRGRDS